MTHHDEGSVTCDLIDPAMKHGPDAMVAAFATLMNHVLQIEREQKLEAESRSVADRPGDANGSKPKTLDTRVGTFDLRILRTRSSLDGNGRPFSPKALERCTHGKRALTLAASRFSEAVLLARHTRLTSSEWFADVPLAGISCEILFEGFTPWRVVAVIAVLPTRVRPAGFTLESRVSRAASPSRWRRLLTAPLRSRSSILALRLGEAVGAVDFEEPLDVADLVRLVDPRASAKASSNRIGAPERLMNRQRWWSTQSMLGLPSG
jgi:hypothetical protein